MMKTMRTALILLVVVALVCPVLPVHAASGLTVNVGTAQANAGATVTINLMVTGNVGVSYLCGTLEYDKSVLELTGVTNGGVLKDLDQGTNLLWSADKNSTATGVLATLKFKVSGNAALGKYTVKLTVRECYNASLQSVSASATAGYIQLSTSHVNTAEVGEMPATCKDPGYTAGVFCNDCQTYISGHDVIPATGVHSGGEATCQTPASCDGCGITYGQPDPHNHKGGTEIRNAVAPGCSAGGYTGDTYCLDCGEKSAAGTAIAASGDHVDVNGDDRCDVCNAGMGRITTLLIILIVLLAILILLIALTPLFVHLAKKKKAVAHVR